MSPRPNHAAAGRILPVLLIALALACLAPSRAATAQTINSNEFVALPPGTNLALGYYQHERFGAYNLKGAGTFRDQTGLAINLGALRFVHFLDVAGYDAAVQIIQSFAATSAGRIAGAPLNDASGFGDTTLGVAFWPLSDHGSKTYVALAGYLNLPDGQYDRNKALSIGDDRMSGVVQLGLNKGFGDHLSVDFAIDGEIYGNGGNAPVTGGRLTQDPSFRLQGFVNYAVTPYANLSVGLEGVHGGKQAVDGAATGAKTEFQRLRLGGSTFVSPTWQVLAEFDHDFHAIGGFSEDFAATLRLLKIF